MWHKFLLWASKHYLRGRTRRRPPRSLAELDVAAVRRVLLLNATALGDFLFSTPTFRALKETYPAWQLDALITPSHRDLAAHNPHLSYLWLYPGRGKALLALMRQLSQEHYDLVIILHGNDPEATLIAYATGAPFVIGSAQSPLAFAYSATISHSDPLEHAIERRLAYARVLGADTEDRRMELTLPASEVRQAKDILVDHFGGKIPDLLVALHPMGSAPYKWWPLERYAELGQHLFERYGAALLIISNGRERAAAERFFEISEKAAEVTGGRYPLLTVAGFLSHCRLLVANDSGPLHMGLALGVPTLALLGADHPARIGPYRVNWGTHLYSKEGACPEPDCLTRRCPDNRCLQAISTAEIIATLASWWEPRYINKERN